MTELILASGSATRAAMLRDAAVPVTAIPAAIDEDALKRDLLSTATQPGELATELARAKAADISAGHPGALVLGADQILVHRGNVYSKPADMAEARRHLATLRGSRHQLISAAVMVREGAVVWQHTDTVTLTMRDFTDSFLDAYLARIGDLALTSVGCYHLEGPGAQLFSRVEGDYFSVLGLPLLPVLASLRTQGLLPT